MSMNSRRLLSRAGVPACLLPAALALAVFDAGAQSYLPVAGGTGGISFQAPCPGTQVLTGVRLYAGNDVDAIQPMCGIAHGPEKVVIQPGPPAVYGKASGTSGALGIQERKESEGWYGGAGGGPRELRCPARAPVVLAMMVASEGQATVVVNSIGLFCGKATDAPQAVPQYPTALFEAPATGGKRHFKSVSRGCPPGQVAVGLHGRQDVWVHALGLVCDVPTMVIASMGSGRRTTPISPMSAEQATETVAKPSLPITIPSMGRRRPDASTSTGAEDARQQHQIPDPPVCAKARSARERGSPVVDSLAGQCRDQGGIP